MRWALCVTSAFASHTVIAGDMAFDLDQLHDLLPADTRVCSGHVNGGWSPDGQPNMHIVWEAFGSSLEIDAIVSMLRAKLSEASEVESDGCTTWRWDENARFVLSVCTADSPRAWKDCKDFDGVRTTLLYSQAIGSLDR